MTKSRISLSIIIILISILIFHFKKKHFFFLLMIFQHANFIHDFDGIHSRYFPFEYFHNFTDMKILYIHVSFELINFIWKIAFPWFFWPENTLQVSMIWTIFLLFFLFFTCSMIFRHSFVTQFLITNVQTIMNIKIINAIF